MDYIIEKNPDESIMEAYMLILHFGAQTWQCLVTAYLSWVSGHAGL